MMRTEHGCRSGRPVHVWLQAALIVGLILACAAHADRGLAAHYTFEEGPGGKVKDWSGNGNDGKNLGAKYVRLPDGKGFALRFDTAAAQVNCGSGPTLDLKEEISIELWLYPETRPTKGEAGLVGKSLTTYMLTYSQSCWFYVGTGPTRNDCSARAPAKTWTHVVATFDGRNVRTYSDGTPRNVTESKHEEINSGGDFFLRYPVVWGDKVEPVFRCMMDDVKVYSRVLSEAEVLRRYRAGAKARGKDLQWAEKVRLTPHVVAAAPQLVIEAEFAEMKLGLLSPGARLAIEVRDVARDQVRALHETADLPASGRLDWTVNTRDFPPGDYEVKSSVRDKNGEPFGVPSTARVKLSREKPAWIAAYDDVKVLNNFVAELLDVPGQKEARREYAFTNPRDGWVLISSEARATGGDRVLLSVDPDTVNVHTKDTKPALEGMRHLPAGRHSLLVRCEGATRPSSIAVRSIAEVIYAELGYEPCPFMESYGPYTWEHLEKIGFMENVNVVLERNAKPENAAHMQKWLRQGKRRLSYYNNHWLVPKGQLVTGDAAFARWSDSGGFRGEGYHGLMADEFSGGGDPAEYRAFTDAIERLGRDPKLKGRALYPYAVALHSSESGRAFLKAVLDAGYKWAEERYLLEQPTEAAAIEHMNQELRLNMLRYQDTFPDCTGDMVMNLGFISLPHETQSVNPGVDFKVYLDMQMHLLANDPAFFGTYGAMWYHSAYADEEILRWAARLHRHYCIEGKRERLTNDPYVLPHIENPDFDQGTLGWMVQPAEAGSVFTGRALGYGWLQGRFKQAGEGDRFLVTRRRAKRPNRFSQTIRKLTPGRAYSLKMFITDYTELTEGKSAKTVNRVRINIDDAKLIPKSSFVEIVTNGGGHYYGKFAPGNNIQMTYRRVVFRPTRPTALLTVSDWAGDKDPGGPVGQKLAINFIEIEPYLDE